LIKYVTARYSDGARQRKVQGTVTLSLIVDSNGLPRQIKVVRSLAPDLDENAVAALNCYRFSPALHDNQPVAVPIAVQVNFRLY
jgi:TonB family protein